MHMLGDLLILAILLFCAWQGYKRGVIGGILAILVIIVSMYGANLVANTYSYEFTSMTRPFISGYLDGVEREIVDDLAPSGLRALSTEDLLRHEPGLEPVMARQVFLSLGVHESRTEPLLERYFTYRDGGATVNQAMTDVLVEAFCFYLVYIIAFLLIIIALTVVYNIIPLSFRLPGLTLVDDIGGGLLGFAQGLLLVFMLTWALGYVGLLFPEDFLNSTVFTEMLIRANPVVGFINL